MNKTSLGQISEFDYRTITEGWLNHLKNLVVQGDLLRIALLEKSDHGSPSFMISPKGSWNSCLMHFLILLYSWTQNNLSRWGKRINTKCTLCGNKETLQHVLYNCNTMLDRDRYTWRHNSVLHIIMDTLKDVSDQSWTLLLWSGQCQTR